MFTLHKITCNLIKYTELASECNVWESKSPKFLGAMKAVMETSYVSSHLQ